MCVSVSAVVQAVSRAASQQLPSSFTLLLVNAETIAVGSEMLTPHRQDTNSLYLTDKLNELGVEVRFKSVVGDSTEDLTAAAKLAMRRSDIIILIARLGPSPYPPPPRALPPA